MTGAHQQDHALSGNPATGEAAEAPRSKLRHLGLSVLPLVLFVAGALGIEKIADTTRSPNRAPSRTIVAATAVVSAPVKSMPMLRDSRSLMDLSNTLPATEPTRDDAVPTAAVFAATGRAERRLSFVLGTDTALPLGFDVAAVLRSGAYALLSGIPQSATLSHGISAGNENWLIDGADIAGLELRLRSATPGVLDMKLNVLTQDSRFLAQQRVAVEIKAPHPLVDPIHIVPPTPLALQTRAPDIGPPNAAAQARAVASAKGLRLSLSQNDEPATGPGNRLRFAVEMPEALPSGAYLVLRGVPVQSAISRGMSIGPDVWLLSLADLVGLEIQLPPSAPAIVTLAAKLVTADGQLLAEDEVRYETIPATGRPLPQATRAASSGAIAAAPKPADNPTAAIVTRSLPQPPVARAPEPAKPALPQRQAATPPPRIAGQPPVATQTSPKLDLTASQIAIARARKMLDLGNIVVARPMLERAANEGSAEAAALLAATFDRIWLQRTGALGIADDSAKAAHWYAQARQLGAGDAERIIAETIKR